MLTGNLKNYEIRSKIEKKSIFMKFYLFIFISQLLAYMNSYQLPHIISLINGLIGVLKNINLDSNLKDLAVTLYKWFLYFASSFVLMLIFHLCIFFFNKQETTVNQILLEMYQWMQHQKLSIWMSISTVKNSES